MEDVRRPAPHARAVRRRRLHRRPTSASARQKTAQHLLGHAPEARVGRGSAGQGEAHPALAGRAAATSGAASATCASSAAPSATTASTSARRSASSCARVNDGIVAYSDNGVSGYGNMVMLVHKDELVSIVLPPARQLRLRGPAGEARPGDRRGRRHRHHARPAPALRVARERPRPDPMPRMVGPAPRVAAPWPSPTTGSELPRAPNAARRARRASATTRRTRPPAVCWMS